MPRKPKNRVSTRRKARSSRLQDYETDMPDTPLSTIREDDDSADSVNSTDGHENSAEEEAAHNTATNRQSSSTRMSTPSRRSASPPLQVDVPSSDVEKNLKRVRSLLESLAFFEESNSLERPCAQSDLNELIRAISILRGTSIRDQLTAEQELVVAQAQKDYSRFSELSKPTPVAAPTAQPAVQPIIQQISCPSAEKKGIKLPVYTPKTQDYWDWRSMYNLYLTGDGPVSESVLHHALHSQIVPKLPQRLQEIMNSIRTSARTMEIMDEALGKPEIAIQSVFDSLQKLPDLKRGDYNDLQLFEQKLTQIRATVNTLDVVFVGKGQTQASTDCFSIHSFLAVKKKLSDPILRLLKEAQETQKDAETGKFIYYSGPVLWSFLFDIFDNKMSKLSIDTAPANYKTDKAKTTGALNIIGVAPPDQQEPAFCPPCDDSSHRFFSPKCKSAYGRNPKNVAIFKKNNYCLRCVRPASKCAEQPNDCDGLYQDRTGKVRKTDCRTCVENNKPINKRLCGHGSKPANQRPQPQPANPPPTQQPAVPQQSAAPQQPTATAGGVLDSHVKIVRINTPQHNSGAIVDTIAIVEADGNLMYVDAQFDTGASDSYVQPAPTNESFKTDVVLPSRRVIFGDGRSAFLKDPILYRIPISAADGEIRFVECVELKTYGPDGVSAYELPKSLQDVWDGRLETSNKHPFILVGTNHSNLFPRPVGPESALPDGFAFWKSRLSGKKMLTGSPSYVNAGETHHVRKISSKAWTSIEKDFQKLVEAETDVGDDRKARKALTASLAEPTKVLGYRWNPKPSTSGDFNRPTKPPHSRGPNASPATGRRRNVSGTAAQPDEMSGAPVQRRQPSTSGDFNRPTKPPPSRGPNASPATGRRGNVSGTAAQSDEMSGAPVQRRQPSTSGDFNRSTKPPPSRGPNASPATGRRRNVSGTAAQPDDMSGAPTQRRQPSTFGDFDHSTKPPPSRGSSTSPAKGCRRNVSGTAAKPDEMSAAPVERRQPPTSGHLKPPEKPPPYKGPDASPAVGRCRNVSGAAAQPNEMLAAPPECKLGSVSSKQVCRQRSPSISPPILRGHPPTSRSSTSASPSEAVPDSTGSAPGSKPKPANLVQSRETPSIDHPGSPSLTRELEDAAPSAFPGTDPPDLTGPSSEQPATPDKASHDLSSRNHSIPAQSTASKVAFLNAIEIKPTLRDLAANLQQELLPPAATQRGLKAIAEFIGQSSLIAKISTGVAARRRCPQPSRVPDRDGPHPRLVADPTQRERPPEPGNCVHVRGKTAAPLCAGPGSLARPRARAANASGG